MIRQVRSPADMQRQHLQALHVGSEVTRWFRKEREPNVLHVTPERILAALHRAGQPACHSRRECTGDKETRSQGDPRAGEAFPYLEVFENPAAVCFLNPVTRKVVIDVMKPTSRVMQSVFRHAVPIGKTHWIPDLEMALVSKFAAMVSPNQAKLRKAQDGVDFAVIVTHNKNDVDLKKL